MSRRLSSRLLLVSVASIIGMCHVSLTSIIHACRGHVYCFVRVMSLIGMCRVSHVYHSCMSWSCLLFHTCHVSHWYVSLACATLASVDTGWIRFAGTSTWFSSNRDMLGLHVGLAPANPTVDMLGMQHAPPLGLDPQT
jgi:hypothetical protein